jgi:hypothetical protein
MTPEEMLLSLPDLSIEAATDYLEWRKFKKAPLNRTIWKTISKHIVMSGWAADDALGEAMSAGWLSLRSEWLNNRARPPQKDERGFIEKHTDRSWTIGLDDFMDKH